MDIVCVREEKISNNAISSRTGTNRRRVGWRSGAKALAVGGCNLRHQPLRNLNLDASRRILRGARSQRAQRQASSAAARKQVKETNPRRGDSLPSLRRTCFASASAGSSCTPSTASKLSSVLDAVPSGLPSGAALANTPLRGAVGRARPGEARGSAGCTRAAACSRRDALPGADKGRSARAMVPAARHAANSTSARRAQAAAVVCRPAWGAEGQQFWLRADVIVRLQKRTHATDAGTRSGTVQLTAPGAMAALTARLQPRCGASALPVQPRCSAAASRAPARRLGPQVSPCGRARLAALRSPCRTSTRGRAPTRSPRAAVVAAPTAAVAAVSHTLLQTLASLLGAAMGAGSLLLYSPIVLRLVRTRSAQGMALSTWALQFFGFTAGVMYSASKGFPLTTYAETLSFTVQARSAPGAAPRRVACARIGRALSACGAASPRLGRSARRPPGPDAPPARRAPPSWCWWRTCSGGFARPPSRWAAPRTRACARLSCGACRPGRCRRCS